MHLPAPQPPSGAISRVVVRSSEGRAWDGFGAELFTVSAGLHAIAARPHHRVAVHVGAAVKAHCACDGRPSARIQTQGDVDVVPAGVDGRWNDDAGCTIFGVWMTEDFVRAATEQMSGAAGRRQLHPQLQLRDPRFVHLAWALRAELEAEAASDPLYAESLCTAMVVRLVCGEAPADVKQQKLGTVPAARVLDYIESNLAKRLSLSELAAVAGLSVPHFSALFRQTLNMPAHQYVVRRRVERARTLLLHTKLSMSQVALDVGFAHQSHLAHWMNRILGMTPRDVQKAA
ncbi:helix-turn-helix domain-containing protein [Duganella hordei]|uniref:helix-turn-helix domain-containing protein n=1 Tax=Duganella hordei TaxID=2865934 RepID=UPI0030E7B456